jgi:hypothetical protein
MMGEVGAKERKKFLDDDVIPPPLEEGPLRKFLPLLLLMLGSVV